MSLARICATVATPAELADLLEQQEEEANRFRAALLWALGEHEEFDPRPDGSGPYWWREELRRRAGL